jgi:Ca2+-binding RTX toxin-like protein
MARDLIRRIENWAQYNDIYQISDPLYLADYQTTYMNWDLVKSETGWFSWMIHEYEYHTEIYGSGVDNVIHGNGDTSWAWYWGTDVTWRGAADNIHGGGGNDRIWGYTGDDSLYGDDGNDMLFGGDGNDRLEGGTGDDILLGGNGTDTLIGGEGGDWLVSGALTNGASDVLTGGSGADVFVLGEAAKETTTPGQDWGKFALNFAFSMFGDISDTVFVGGKFDGTFKGKMGKEILPSVAGLIQGVIGIATADQGSTQPPAEAAYAKVTDFNPLEDVILIPLNGTGPINIFLSLDTNGENAITIKSDTEGASGIIATINFEDAAKIYGIDGMTLSPLAKQAFLRTIVENAIIMGHDGATLGLENKVKLDIDPAVLASFGSSKFMLLGAYAGMTLQGGNSADYMFGTNHNDVIAGYVLDASGGIAFAPELSGNDELRGFGGDDLIFSGGGNDYIFGGTGSDTVSFVHGKKGVVVDLGAGLVDANGTYGTAQDGFGGFDKLYEVENIIGTGFADVIHGDAGANTLQGLGGDDVYMGRGGADRFILDGGIDRILDFSAEEGDKLLVSLTAHGIESLNDLVYVGPNAKGIAKLIVGATGATVAILEKMRGKSFDLARDVVLPGDQDGYVFGGSGADSFVDQAGDQLYFGLGGSDSLSFAGASGQVVVNLAALEWDSNGSFARVTHADGSHDRLYGIENVQTGSGNDYLIGDAQNNILDGGAGDDIMMGGAGADTFVLRGGCDTVLDYNRAEGDQIIVDAAAYDIWATHNLFVRNGNELFTKIGRGEVLILTTSGGLQVEDVILAGVNGDSFDFFG